MNWRTIGFEKQKRMFEALAVSGNLSRAYIFSGPEQIGKLTFARDLFVSLNKRRNFDANDPDWFMLAPKDTEKETKIYTEDIRGLKTFLSLTPYYGPYKMAVIDDAHRLTPEASNALLKILEEPTPSTIFVLISGQIQEILPTVISRCEKVYFLPHADEILRDLPELKKLNETDRSVVAAIARGRLGWALSAAAPENLEEIKKTIFDFQKILGSPLAERMLYVKSLLEKNSYRDSVDCWLAWAYINQAELPNSSRLLAGLLNLHRRLNQPQYNHRALLENTLINL